MSILVIRMNTEHQTGRYESRLADTKWKSRIYSRKDSAQESMLSMLYRAIPEALLDGPDKGCAWARRALACL